MPHRITSKTSLYGIIGYPVRHTLSPIIHNECFIKKGVDAVYLAFEVHPQQLKSAIEGIKSLGIKGVSVTIPHKKACMKYLDEIDEIARGIGAVNTILNRNRKLYGTNTDYMGVIKAFQKHRVKLKGKKAMVIGSGGASRAVCFALGEMGISEIYITGIVEKEIKELVKDLKKRYKNIKIKGFLRNENTEKNLCKTVEIIANASPLGMHPEEKSIPINPAFIEKRHILFDVVYTPEWTVFLKTGKKKGCKTITGVEMFVYQAIEQFQLFTGKKVDEKLIKSILKRKSR